MNDKPSYDHLFIIDGSGYIFRAYFALKTPMTTSQGVPVSAVFGFTNMLLKFLRDNEVGGLVVVFDAGRRTFRNDIFEDYKAQRPDPPEDLVPQFAIVREAAEAFSLPIIEIENYEADDIIATLACQARDAGVEVTIVSSDKDLMQLVGDGIDMLDPIRNTSIGPEEVEEKFGVPPDKVVDVQALAGDSVDNVPGVPGIGVKTAATLIQTYGDLETLLARAEEIKQPKRRERLIEFADQARISRRLVELDCEAPLSDGLDAWKKPEPDPEKLRSFLETYEFRSILARLSDQLGIEPAELASDTTSAPPLGNYEHYGLIQDWDALDACIASAYESGVVAIDTETTSLDPQVAELGASSLSVAEGHGCYIPLGHKAPEGGSGGLELEGDQAPQQLDRDAVLQRLAPLLSDGAVLKVGQNLKYDMRVLARYGISLTPIDDTMLLSYVLEGGAHGHGMDELAKLYLDHTCIPYKEVAGSGRSQVTFDRVPLDKARDYAAEDADVTFRLWRLLKPRLPLEQVTAVYETMERRLVPVLLDMEWTGIKVEREHLRRLSNDFARRIDTLEQEIHQLAGRDFTIGSTKQMGEVLYDEMGLTGGVRIGKTVD